MIKKYMLLLLCGSLLCAPVHGQTVKKVLRKAGTMSGYFRNFDILGTWIYEGTDVKFESESLLKKAGVRSWRPR